jgi:hypothetical protein
MEEIAPQIKVGLNPHIGLAQGQKKPPYARSLKGSSYAATCHRITVESREIYVMAHRILTHRTPRTP